MTGVINTFLVLASASTNYDRAWFRLAGNINISQLFKFYPSPAGGALENHVALFILVDALKFFLQMKFLFFLN